MMDELYVYCFKSVGSYKHKLSRIESLVILYWGINCILINAGQLGLVSSPTGSSLPWSSQPGPVLSLLFISMLENPKGQGCLILRNNVPLFPFYNSIPYRTRSDHIILTIIISTLHDKYILPD